MKRVIFLLGIMLLMAGAAKAQDAKTQSGPEIEFEEIVHDYGDVPYNGNGECEFRFTNTGDAPLLIQKPKSSCGCTVPEYTKTPVKPGEKGEIKVTYNGTGKFPGHFKKIITVRTNGAVEMTRLYIEGDMTEATE